VKTTMAETISRLAASGVRRVPRRLVLAIDRMPRVKRALRSAARRLTSGTSGKVAFRPSSGPLQGYTLFLDLDRDDRAMWLNAYEPWVHEQLRTSLTRGMVTWDVGAYIGYYVLLMHGLTGAPVVAFEPDADNVRRLTEHLDVNRVGDVELVQKAVSDTGEPLRFVGAGEWGTVRDDGEVVECTTLDAVLADHPPPGLVLMDIEGGEDRALAGARRLVEEIRPIWVIELHWEAGLRAAEHLRNAGYVVTGSDPGVDLATQIRHTQRTHIIARPA
jgi:FkbM family methyltransferase